ncbi:hypothetical protein [Limnobacter sp.]|uniref:hypothetical protein n=1 Tax=Limnobacter sp. TaxID=2003368 RepID=UPI00391BA3B0
MLGTVVTALTLSGCGPKAPKEPPLEEKISKVVEEAVKLKLKDPDSAQFRNVYVKKILTEENSYAVCGELNAKNSMGGYVGFKPFLAFASTKENEVKAGDTYLDDNECSTKYPR